MSESDPGGIRVRFSFPFKLTLTMLLVAGLCGVGTLLVIQRQIEDTYRGFLESQVTDQVDFFFEKQAVRLASVRDTLVGATLNVRLIAALRSDSSRFYTDLGFELEDILQRLARENAWVDSSLEERQRDRERAPAAAAEGAEIAGKAKDPAEGAAGGEPRADEDEELDGGMMPEPHPVASRFVRPFFRFVRADGTMLRPDDASAGYVPGVDEELLEERLARLVSDWEEAQEEPLGYLVLESYGKQLLYEVVTAPVIDFSYGEWLGEVVFGNPVNRIEAVTGRGNSRLLSGLIVDGRIYSARIPRAARGPIGEIYRKMEVMEGRPAELIIAGMPHLISFDSLTDAKRFPPAYLISLYSLAEMVALVEIVRQSAIGLGLLSLCAALILGALFSRGLTRQLSDLAAAMGEVRKGRFDVRVPVRSRDEVGQATAAFGEMVSELALKERMRGVLDKVADAEVAQELLAGNMELGGEERDVAVLFCDIRGFTPLTEGMPPRQIIAMVNEHMTTLTRVIYQHGGVVDKFVGDEVMVLFGAPRSRGNDTLNSIRCALEMMAERERLNRETGRVVEIGIGLAVGEAIAGLMGSQDRLSYTVVGERVNLASRLCGAAGPGEVIIDAHTREQVGVHLQVEPRDPIRLKGFSEPVEICRVIAVGG